MKFVEIVMVMLMINLTALLVSSTGILPGVNGVEANLNSQAEFLDADGNLLDVNTSLAKRIVNMDSYVYRSPGLQDQSLGYLQAGSDFVKGLYLFFDIFLKGTTLIYPTLRMFGVPSQIYFWIIAPFMLMYALAVIQLISGRTFEGNK
jgi:hypothetical protein